VPARRGHAAAGIGHHGQAVRRNGRGAVDHQPSVVWSNARMSSWVPGGALKTFGKSTGRRRERGHSRGLDRDVEGMLHDSRGEHVRHDRRGTC